MGLGSFQIQLRGKRFFPLPLGGEGGGEGGLLGFPLTSILSPTGRGGLRGAIFSKTL
jgi:hypothetical protein